MFKAARAFLIILLLACPALAGDTQYGTPAPPPPPRYYDGDEPTPENGDPTVLTDATIEAAFSVFSNVLALL